MNRTPPEYSVEQVNRLWFHCQKLTQAQKPDSLNPQAFTEFLENAGGLQVDSVNVLDRAHYLTLWSRFGVYDRSSVDDWIYRDQLAYEYWGHEASILPASHLPLGRRRMRDFPPASWENASYWSRYQTSEESKRRVLKVIRKLGAVESTDFERTLKDDLNATVLGWGSMIPKEDKRSLQLLWHAGKLAIAGRKHFRKVYDLSKRVYPETVTATKQQYFDSWLFISLRGCGIATEQHLCNYWTGPNLKAPERATVIARNLKQGKIVQVSVKGSSKAWYALPEHLEKLDSLDAPTGTTLVCPFDSLLWQRKRAEELLGFRYRVEIYIPEEKREFGYYVLPILHNGKLVGRLDPKLHRDTKTLEIRQLFYEPEFKLSKSFSRDLQRVLRSLAKFVGAKNLKQA